MLRQAVMMSVVLSSAWGCGSVLGPSCLSKQERGAVTTVTGTVEAGAVIVHEVPYGTRGSQNDLRVTWGGQHALGGARIRVYATKTDCFDFKPPVDVGPTPTTSACATLGSWGGVLSPEARPCAVAHTCDPQQGDLVQTSLTIANGRGNPDVLGSEARYKLWVVGDPTQAASYIIDVTFFYGPDC